MSKYVIKNCPAAYIFKSGYACNNLDYDEHKFCQDIENCLLKRIVKKCELAKQGIGLSMKNFADEILEILESEEVE